MSLSVTTFRWLEMLEAEFDRAYMELDNLLSDPEGDLDYIMGPARQKMAILCSAFAQLTEKAQSVSFQANAKLEAQVLNLRQDLVESQSERDYIDQENRHLLVELHKAQLEHVHDDGGQSKSILRSLIDGQGDVTSISLEEARLAREAIQLKKENLQLRQMIMTLESDLFGAHLATRYLDKELAGRIQQIQLLSRGAGPEESRRLWNHLEAEISLQRHKTIIQACRGRSRRKKCLVSKSPSNGQDATFSAPAIPMLNECLPGPEPSVARRQVSIHKEVGKPVGISVTGGVEHGVPILISELKEGQLAQMSGKFVVGDAILSVNGTDLRHVTHGQAVQILSSLEGDITFELLFIQPDSEDEVSFTEDFSFLGENGGTADSLRALSATRSNSNLSQFSQIARRPRFPGRAVLAAGDDDLSNVVPLSSPPPEHHLEARSSA